MNKSEEIKILREQIELQKCYLSSMENALNVTNEKFSEYKEKHRLENNGTQCMNIHSLSFFRDRFYNNTMYGKFILSEYAEEVFNTFLKERNINN
jgi:hypothetical protein